MTADPAEDRLFCFEDILERRFHAVLEEATLSQSLESEIKLSMSI
jgi:hypothetical protein